MDLTEEAVQDYWPVLAKKINDRCDQWLPDWAALEGSLAREVARTQEAQAFARQWMRQITQHREQAAKNCVVLDEEITHLTASWETTQTQLTAAKEEVCIATAQVVEEGLTVARVMTDWEAAKARSQEEAQLIAKARTEVVDLRVEQAEVAVVVVQQQEEISALNQQREEGRKELSSAKATLAKREGKLQQVQASYGNLEAGIVSLKDQLEASQSENLTHQVTIFEL